MAHASLPSFGGFAGERILVGRADDALDGELVLLSSAPARGLLRKWFADPIDRRTLLGVYEALSRHAALELAAHGDVHEPMLDDLASAFERGDLVLLGRPDLAGPQLSAQPGQDRPSSGPQAPRRSWIEIELLDEDGRRVATELVVTLPDGTKMRPSFSGFLRLDGIDPGTCDIEFPRIDGREWGAFVFRR